MKIFRIIYILILLSSFLLSSSQFSKVLVLHSYMFSDNKDTALIELKEKLDFYKKIGIEHLYIFKTLKKEHMKGWDFLKQFIIIAHKKGLKVHPIVTSGQKVKIEGKIKKNPDWLIKDPFGKTIPYLNLSNPDVRKYIKKRVKKLQKYNVDGILLDYIRFPYMSSKQPGDSVMSILIRVIRIALNYYVPDHIYHRIADNYFSYDRKTIEMFEKQFRELDEDSLNEREYILKEWREWNASNVTLLVKNIEEQIRKSGRNIPLSAAIFSNKEFAFNSLGQDWGTWARGGIVDVLCPMIYSNDNNWFRERLRGVLDVVQGRCKVYAVIAIKSSTNSNFPEGVASQIRISKEMGAQGVVIFSGFSLTEEFGKVIQKTVSEIRIKELGDRR